MDAKEAVDIAKNTVTDWFAPEGIVNLGLEEVEYDDAKEQWHITVGFSRSWDRPRGVMEALTAPARTYKIVSIDKDKKVLSVKNRATADAG